MPRHIFGKEIFYINKMELVAAMGEKYGLLKKDCEAALNAMTKMVTDALKAESKVQLVGFGTFEVKSRGARTGRNPRRFGWKFSRCFRAHLMLFVPSAAAFQTFPLQCLRPLPARSESAFGSNLSNCAKRAGLPQSSRSPAQSEEEYF